MSDLVRYDLDGDVAVLRLDDGKANALGPPMIEALNAALDRAAKEAGAVLMVGREGRFSAGFDLGVMQQGAEAGRALVTSGAKLAVRIARHPTPVVLAATGHALAMGAVLLAAADLRLGAAGNFKIGFNEVAIGMITPIFLLEFARERLSKRHLYRATVLAEIYAPEDAVDAGFLDRLVAPEDLVTTAMEEARRLAQLPRGAFVGTRRLVREKTLAGIEATLADDIIRAFSPR